MATKTRQYRILVVEDDDNYRESECALLRAKGYEAYSASNPEEAKPLFSKQSFHLSLIDNQMPERTGETRDDAGIKFARWIKENHPYTGRIIITKLEDIEIAKQALLPEEEKGEKIVDAYFQKQHIASGRVKDLLSLVSDNLSNRPLIWLASWGGYPNEVDSLDFWGEQGVVEHDIERFGTGSVRLESGLFKASMARGYYVNRIKKGTTVKARAVRASRLEVLPLGNEY